MTSTGCQHLGATRWLARQPEPKHLLLGRPVVEICSAGDDRGLGLFAISPIQAFSHIVTDPPMILMQPEDDLPELYQRFLNLSDHQQRTFLALTYAINDERDALLRSRILGRGLDQQHGQDALQQMIKVANLMQTNAFNVDLQDGRGSCHRAVFTTIARINHSCAPNAHVCFYPSSPFADSGPRMVVHALKALRAGEEITISYFNMLLPWFERQEKALKWGFHCTCPVCAHDLPETEGEELRKMLRNFHSNQAEIMQSMRVTLGEIHSLTEFGNKLVDKALAQPALYPTLPDLYDALGMLQAKASVLQKNDEQRSQIVSRLEQSILWEARITGRESPPTNKRLHKLTQFAMQKDSRKKATVPLNEKNDFVIVWQDML